MRVLFVAGVVAAVLSLGSAYRADLAAVERPPEDPKQSPDLKPLDSEGAAKLENRVQKLYASLAPSIVRIFNPKGSSGFSGVIVSSSGEILTCAHHNLMPNTKVTMELADGRKIKATILG